MRYGTPNSWSRYFEKHESVQVTDVSIRNRLKELGILAKVGRDKLGRICQNFSEDDVRKAVADLIQQLPRADEEGFFKLKNVLYGTITSWSRKLKISEATVGRCVRKSVIEGIKGRDFKGRIFDYYSEDDIRSVCKEYLDFYAEPVVRDICAHLLDNYPQSGKDSTIILEGERYRTVKAWARELNVSFYYVLTRLKKAQRKSIKGKDVCGKIRDFFSESDINEVCMELFEDLPKEDDNGIYKIGDNVHRSVNGWIQILGVSYATFVKKLTDADKNESEGRNKQGKKISIYSEDDVNEVFPGLLQNIPKTDDYGFYMENGVRYGTLSAWSKLFNLGYYTILNRLKKTEKKGIKGRYKSGTSILYSEPDILSACADLLAKRESKKPNPKDE